MTYAVYLLTLLCGIGVLVTARRLWRALAARGWPVVDGEVVAATMEYKEFHDSPGLNCQPRITYRYNFRGREFESDNYNVLPEWLDRQTAISILSRYEVGRRIEVRVNPVDPEIAVLEAGARFGHYFVLLACAGFFGAFLYAILQRGT